LNEMSANRMDIDEHREFTCCMVNFCSETESENKNALQNTTLLGFRQQSQD
jgi:hypothetical protein